MTTDSRKVEVSLGARSEPAVITAVDIVGNPVRELVDVPRADRLILEITLEEAGYTVSYETERVTEFYVYRHQCGYYTAMTRAEMVKRHVEVIREQGPQTVVIRSGEVEVPLLPKVVKGIIEGKLTAAELTL